MNVRMTSCAAAAIVAITLIAAPPPVTDAAPTTAPATRPSATPVLGRWEPVSWVLANFGEMRVTKERVRWASGQASKYEVVGEDGRGVLLRFLADPPILHRTPYPYVRLHRRPGGPHSMHMEELEASFYENVEQARAHGVSMWGFYLPPRE